MAVVGDRGRGGFYRNPAAGEQGRAAGLGAGAQLIRAALDSDVLFL